MDIFVNFVSWFLLVGGALFCVVGSIGLLRMPDAFTRLHAASIIDTLGFLMVMSGLIIQTGLTLTTLRLLIVVFLIIFTSPVAGHALANAMKHKNVKPVLHEDKWLNKLKSE